MRKPIAVKVHDNPSAEAISRRLFFNHWLLLPGRQGSSLQFVPFHDSIGQPDGLA
jgi:hypothetical protein